MIGILNRLLATFGPNGAQPWQLQAQEVFQIPENPLESGAMKVPEFPKW